MKKVKAVDTVTRMGEIREKLSEKYWKRIALLKKDVEKIKKNTVLKFQKLFTVKK